MLLASKVKYCNTTKMAATSGIEHPRQIALHQVTNSAFWLLNFSKVQRLLPRMTADCLDAWKKYSVVKMMTVMTIQTTGDKGRHDSMLVLYWKAWHKARLLELSYNCTKSALFKRVLWSPAHRKTFFIWKGYFLKKYFNVIYPSAHIVIVIARARTKVMCDVCSLKVCGGLNLSCYVILCRENPFHG